MKNREWWLKARVGKENDGRVRLTDDNRKDIVKLYNEDTPVREIARIFEGVCSRRMIQFVIFPERLEVVRQNAIDKKAWLLYYTKEKGTETRRKYRAKLLKLNA